MRSLTRDFLRYFSPKSAEMSRTNLNSSFGDHELHSFVSCSLGGELGNEKKKTLSLRLKISISFGSIYEYKIFYGERNNVHQAEDEVRLSWGSTVKTKLLSPTSLALMRLVPGDDRAVRRICIRCIIVSFR